jgi:glycosyltransferase involved in cell wall biosynthesis
MPRPRIALVSRELAPVFGGGIGVYVAAAAQVLAPVAEVTIFTTDRHRREHERLAAAGDPRVAGLRVRFVPEPRGWEVEDHHGSYLHLWSERAFAALCAAYPDGGPDLVEFGDFLGEGFVTVQAARSADPRLRRTTVCVRLHSTALMNDVLNGYLPDAFERRVTYELERYALLHCDRVLWPGGDVLATYERELGRLPSPLRVRNPLPGGALPDAVAPPADPPAGGPRMLYVGRLERRKGVLDLARAFSGVDAPDLRLTLVGADTETAPLGTSMRAALAQALGGDPRVTFLDRAGRGELPALIDAHDVVVLPSLWECWPMVALEALERNRPVLATPTGGFTEIVVEGRSGWLTDEPGAEPLARRIEQLVASPDELAAPRRSGEPRAVFAELTDPEPIRAAYAELAAAAPPRSRARRRRAPAPPLVSIVIPYHRLARFVEATVRSAVEQSHPRTEVIVVNDGSFDPADAILADLADRYPVAVVTQPNSGLGTARNTGVSQSRGDYVFFLDADNLARPTFVERCVDVLEADRSLAYATSWARYVDDHGADWGVGGRGLRPLGNWSELVEERNVAGDAAAVFRRAVLDRFPFSRDLTSFEDWALYRALRRAGLFGQVIPEILLDYRIREDSMMRQIGDPNAARIAGEIRARLAEASVEWRVAD